MSDAVWLAVLVAIPSILTVLMPLVMARVNNSQKNLEREADWERQDKIAHDLAAKVAESASTAALSRASIIGKLDVVQTLVNGNVTDLMRRELDGAMREVALLEQLHALKAELKQEPNPVEEATLELARVRVIELKAMLAAKSMADAEAKHQTAGAAKSDTKDSP